MLPPWLPILRQFGPALIVQCQNAIRLSEELVATWLGRYMFAKTPKGAAKAARVAKRLNSHKEFKSHGRFLSREELRSDKFGLVIEDMEADQKAQDAILSVFHAVTHTLSAANAVKIIENNLGRAFIKTQQIAFATPPGVPPAALFPPIQLPTNPS